MSAVASPPESPFRGLTPFGESELDAVLFFGRDREREVIVANLMASRLTLLYGPSGVGKSSLLRAGVAYHLRRLAADNVARGEPPQLGVVFFSSWSDEPVAGIVRAAAAEVERLTGDALSLADGVGLADALDICAAAIGGELYVVLDQVEEYFTYRDRRNGGGDRFSAEFADAVNRREVRAHFVLSLREDELARLDAFKASIPGVFGNFLRLDRLDRRAARDAIEGPLQAWHAWADELVVAEPELVEAVLDEVSVGRITAPGGANRNGSVEHESARIEAPYLQLVMQRVWEAERATESTRLRATTLAALGGGERIVGEHLERALAELSVDEKDAAARMFTYLVTPSGSKIAHAPRDLADYAGLERSRAESVLRALAAQRIVRPVDAPGADGARYEIFHDVLGDTVMEWRAGYVAERRLVEERAAARRRQRQLLAIASVALVALAVVGSIAVYAWEQRSDARSEARAADASRLVLAAHTEAETDPELSMLLALEAAELEPTPAVEQALRRALLRAKALGVNRVGDAALAAAFVRGGVAAVTADGRLHTLGGAVTRLADGAEVAAFDPAGARVAVGRGRVVTVHRIPNGRLLRRLRMRAVIARLALGSASVAIADRGGDVAVVPLGAGPAYRTSVRMTATAVAIRGGKLAVASSHTVRVFRIGRRRAQATFVDREAVGALAFSPNGRMLATASRDGGVRTFSTSGRLTNVLGSFEARGTALAWTPDGERVVIGFEDGTGAIERVKDGRDLGVYVGHGEEVRAVSVSADGARAATASSDGTVRVWDAVGDPRLTYVRSLRRDPTAVVWRRGVPKALFGGGSTARLDPGARVVGADLRLPTGLVLKGAGTRLRAARFSSDGRYVATADGTALVRIWRTDRVASPLGELPHSSPINDASFSPDGRWLVTAAARTVYLWNVSRPREHHFELLLEGHSDVVVSAAFSPDGGRIASASLDRTVRSYRCHICGRLAALSARAKAHLRLVDRRLTVAERRAFLGRSD